MMILKFVVGDRSKKLGVLKKRVGETERTVSTKSSYRDL